MTINFSRFLRAAFRNAVVWGAGWFVMAMGVLTYRMLAGIAPPNIDTVDNIGMAIRIGFMGGIAGAAFSSFIRLRYHGERLRQLSWWKFGIAGAILIGLFVPTFLIVANVLTGGSPPPWRDISMDTMIGFGFGGVAAAVTVKLAQLADRFAADPAEEQALLDAGRSAPAARSRENAQARARRED